MTKSLAELRASQHTSLPERSYSLCLASGLVAEVQALLSELDSLAVKSRTSTNGDGETTGPPKRVGDPNALRVREVNDRLAELWAEIEEHTGELRLRAITDGEWRRWVDEHPAREGNARDDEITYGTCDADALMLDLGKWAHSWNGDALTEGDWAFIESKAPTGDLKQIARTVVVMHEMAADLGKLRALSLGTPGSANN